MSRTPETIPDKAQEQRQNWLYTLGSIFLLLSLGACSGNDGSGAGVVFAVIGLAILFGASSMETTKKKKGEIGWY